MKSSDYVNEEELQNRREQLRMEIEQFEAEKEKIKKDIGDLGGTRFSSKDLITNIVLAVLLVGLLLSQLFLNWIPEFISLEIALFLVSIKIILMIHSQHRYNHFMFWVLNTIEFRLNIMHKSIKKIEETLKIQKK